MAVATTVDDVFSKLELDDDDLLPSELLPQALKSLGIQDEALPDCLKQFNDSNRISKSEMVSVMNDALIADDEDELDDLEGINCTWPCSTILHGKGVIDEAFVQVMTRYFAKRGSTLWQPSSTNAYENNSEPDDEEEMSDTQFRKCMVAKDTSTLKRLYTMIDGAVEDVIESFLEKYQYFSIVSTKDDYTILKFKQDDFYAEHIEVSGLDDDCDGAARRLCIMVFLDDPPTEGGQLHFPYQDLFITPQKGDVIVFPACPLHPNRITPVTGEGCLTYAFNYLM